MKSLVVMSFLVIVAVIVYFNYSQIKSNFYYSECAKPITYKLGVVDPKFGLSDAEANSDIQASVNIWNNSYGKNLFTNSTDGQITVNFVYDQRSALNSQINSLQNQVNSSKTTLSQQITNYESDVAAFNVMIVNFNKKVQQLSKEGKIDRATYDQLVAQQKELASEGQALNVRAKDLNLETVNYNSTLQNLNQNVNEFNQDIAQKPEEGLYNEIDNTVTISLYKPSSGF